jgi:prolipoprotein diacylglyceryltransferase
VSGKPGIKTSFRKVNAMNIHINTDHGAISPYKIFLLLALAAGTAVILRLCIKRGIPAKKALLLAVILQPMCIFCAAVFTFITSGGKNIGIASIGAAAGVYLSALIISRIWNRPGEQRIILQNCTFAMPLMYGIAKTGCFTAGCCHGIEYNGVLCVEYSGKLTGDICVFPVQLLESAVFIAIFIAGMIFLKKHDIHSVHKVTILSAAAKFTLEFLRKSHSHKALSIEQAVCLAITIVCLIDMKKKQKRSSVQELA